MKVLTIGTFDLPHYGHIRLINRCKQFGDVIIGVNSDEFVERYKEKLPVMSQFYRMQFWKELGYETLLNHGPGRELILHVKPDILAVGSDWATREYYKQIDVTQDVLDNNRIMMLYIPYTTGVSSGWIRTKI